MRRQDVGKSCPDILDRSLSSLILLDDDTIRDAREQSVFLADSGEGPA